MFHHQPAALAMLLTKRYADSRARSYGFSVCPECGRVVCRIEHLILPDLVEFQCTQGHTWAVNPDAFLGHDF